MIGVVGEGTDALDAALEATGTALRSGSPEDVIGADPDGIVALGEAAMIELVGGTIPDAPILAVDAGEGFPAIGDASRGVAAAGGTSPGGDLADAVEAFGDGAYSTVEHPVLGVTVGAERVGTAAFDAMVVTSDPGRISEYRVDADGELCQVRADGVVVATPAGSHGYARSAGGPRMRIGADALAVVPVATFTMDSDRWVVAPDAPVEIASQRDVPVSLLLDHGRRELPPDARVTVEATGTITLAVPDSPG